MPAFKTRLLVAVLSWAFIGTLYYLLGTNAHGLDLTTGLDKKIPLVYFMIWPYLSYLILFFGSYFWTEGKRFYRTTCAMMVCCLLASLVFLLLPTLYPRPVQLRWTTLSEYALHRFQEFDPPTNNFPSLHVAFSWVIASNMRSNSQTLFLVWAMLISISTLFVKQHFVIDVFAGYFLARSSLYASKLIFQLKNLALEVCRQAGENNPGMEEP